MSKTGFIAQLLAREPRKAVRFPDYPIDAALAELHQLQSQVQQAEMKSRAATPAPFPTPAVSVAKNPVDEFGPSLAALATHVWRTKGKLMDPITGELKEENKKIYRHVEASLEAFAQLGITLNDWMNQPYDPGLPVKVLTFQPTPGVTRDTVVEAVRPTVIWRDQLLQLAEVIVGIPQNSENPSESKHH